MTPEEKTSADAAARARALAALASEDATGDEPVWAVRLSGTPHLFKFYTEAAARDFVPTHPGLILCRLGENNAWLDIPVPPGAGRPTTLPKDPAPPPDQSP